jgi:hypothetical protein
MSLGHSIQLGRICLSISGVNVSQVDYTSAAIYFDFVTVLHDVVPLGTFSSRDSVVEWITDGKGHHKPVVLSPVVIDQCKLLFRQIGNRKCGCPLYSFKRTVLYTILTTVVTIIVTLAVILAQDKKIMQYARKPSIACTHISQHIFGWARCSTCCILLYDNTISNFPLLKTHTAVSSLNTTGLVSPPAPQPSALSSLPFALHTVHLYCPHAFTLGLATYRTLAQLYLIGLQRKLRIPLLPAAPSITLSLQDGVEQMKLEDTNNLDIRVS